MFNHHFFENQTVYETMWKITVQRDRPHFKLGTTVYKLTVRNILLFLHCSNRGRNTSVGIATRKGLVGPRIYSW
jgi:hypothetical protein